MRVHTIPSVALALALALFGLAACRTPEVPQSLPPYVPTSADLVLREFRLGPHDLIRVGVHGRPELSTPHSERYDGSRLDPSGEVSLPLVGSVALGGLTLDEAREAVTKAYSKYVKEPRIDLAVLEFAARRFYLYGQVNKPGTYTLDRPLNVYQALSFGEGFANGAARDEVVLVRERAEDVEVHVIDGDQVSAAGLMQVHPNDLIFVMRSGSGRFAEQALPIISGISSSLSSAATLLLIEDSITD